MLKLSIKKKKKIGTYCDMGVCVFYFIIFCKQFDRYNGRRNLNPKYLR